MTIFICCVISCAMFVVNTAHEIFRKGLIIVPGLGRGDRLNIVLHNLEVLRHNRDSWDCVVYIYKPKNESFWSSHERNIQNLRSQCDVVENPFRRVTENLFMVQPALIRSAYSHVFVLFDDCRIIETAPPFDLAAIINIMHHNSLTVVSPLVVGANTGGGQKFRNIMQIPAPSGYIGYVSCFVEIFTWIASMAAYEALWDLIYPNINPYGWGQDFWYDNYARERVIGHKMGILSNFQVQHEQGPGREDNAQVKDKWAAVIAQERHYEKYRSVNLKMCRKNLRISNSSWNGAVKGFIYAPDVSVPKSSTPYLQSSVSLKREVRRKRKKFSLA